MPYPAAPGRRMALDADGTIGFNMYVAGSVPNYTSGWEQQTLTEMVRRQKITDGDANAYVGGSDDGRRGFGYIFPEPRDLDGVWVRFYESGNNINSQGRLVSSVDSTDGISGTWVEESPDMPSVSSAASSFREQIFPLAALGVRCIEVDNANDDSNCRGINFHVYGSIAAGATPDRLLFIDELTGLEFSGPVDFGDVPRGSISTRQFRVRNNSATQTASTISLAFEDILMGQAAAWLSVAEGAGSYSSPLLLSAPLAPGATSDLLTLRQSVAGGVVLGPQAPRMRTSGVTWS